MKPRRRQPELTLPGLDTAERVPTPTSKATSRRKRRSWESPAPKPWLATVLAIDTANRSGWAVRASAKQYEFGEADTYDMPALQQIVRWGMHVAKRVDMPLVLVVEEHPWVGSLRTSEGLRAARERWLVTWRAEDLPMSRVVKVTPGEWRSGVLGRKWASAKREDVRVQEQLVAAAMVGEGVAPDEAAALLIAKWASHAQAVGRAIGKRATRESLASWGAR